MAFAAGVARVWCGTKGLLSTPATSAVIRCREEKATSLLEAEQCEATVFTAKQQEIDNDMLRENDM